MNSVYATNINVRISFNYEIIQYHTAIIPQRKCLIRKPQSMVRQHTSMSINMVHISKRNKKLNHKENAIKCKMG